MRWDRRVGPVSVYQSHRDDWPTPSELHGDVNNNHPTTHPTRDYIAAWDQSLEDNRFCACGHRREDHSDHPVVWLQGAAEVTEYDHPCLMCGCCTFEEAK